MCKTLKPTSKRVFIDMGASMKRENNPLEGYLAEFKRFGFHFDHIYGFEVKRFEAKEVYEKILPEELMASYHWINTGKLNQHQQLFIAYYYISFISLL